MSPSRPFILRPIATSLLMVGLLLAGAVGFRQLPVSALPQVDYPTIEIVTFYPGASPDVVASGITAPLERQFGQVPGLNQMTSTSSDGASVITLQFVLDLNIDVAEQEVQAAINAAGSYLPRDLPNPPVYSKTNPADAPILTLALTSKTLPLPAVEDFADTRLTQKISQLPGVGLVSITGGQKPAVRIQVNPTALSSYGLTLEDVRTAVSSSNVNQAKGTFDGPQQAYTIGANDQILSSAQYRALIVAYRTGAPVHLSDVATVIDDTENVRQAAWVNDSPAVVVNIQRQPGANIIAVVDRIKTLLPQLKASLPSSVQLAILTDRTTTIRASVQDVEFELMLVIALVVMVIFLFLRTLAATIIPSVAVPLSIAGTFGAMYLLGYSLNNLTLMALTISTGFVAKSAFFPNVALSATAGLESATLANLLSWPSRFWSIGPSVVQTVFDGGKRRALTAQAEANYDATVAAYRQDVLAAFQDVEDNLAALRILAEEAAQQAEAVRSAERSLALADNRYRAGTTTYLEVITAQTAALANQRTAVDITTRRLTASVLLIKALGGGWTTAQLPAVQ